MVWRKKNNPQILVDNPQELSPIPQQSSCHESAYKLLPEVILILNSQYQITYLNLEAEKMLGSKLRSVMGKDYRSILSLKNLKTDRALQDTVDVSKSEEEKGQEYLLHIKGNQGFPVKLSLIPVTFQNSEGRDESYSLLILKNISGQKMLESQLSMIDTYDGLTGVFNRKSFENEVKQLIDSTHKNNSSHVLAYFSIDKFREINDRFGHAGSENVIKKIRDIIKDNVVEKLDIIAKVGESEFCIILCDRRLASGIKTIEAILSDVVEEEFTARGHQYPVSMSAGFVVINNESTSPSRLMSEANRACNLANKKGIGRPFSYQANDKEIQSQEGNVEWILILKKAIQENRFEMHAQPIHPLSPIEYNKPFSHYELLIRLDDEKGNRISPEEFISAAEYYLMMPSIDRWVIQNVFKQISSIPNQEPTPVFAINLSGQSLNDAAFLGFVLAEIKSSGVDPRMLCFEITEQVAVDDLSLVDKFISTLKALGSSFSLDDFGTGYSSFGYLRSLDVDYLKIDGSFVKNIASDDVAKEMVSSISQLGHTMNLKIIAEYVENTEILNILGDMGIDYGQGYHIERPGPLSAVIKRHQAVKKAINL
jgi:diguanylate cyclase (GGDEF)-like protein